MAETPGQSSILIQRLTAIRSGIRLRLVLFGLFAVLAGGYAASAGIFLANEPVAEVLDYLDLALALMAVAIVLPPFIQLMRLRRSEEWACANTEGFVGEVFRTACVRTFTFMFVLLILAEPLSDRFLLHLPTNFFINVILAATLAMFSLSFLLLNRDDDDEEEPGA